MIAALVLTVVVHAAPEIPPVRPPADRGAAETARVLAKVQAAEDGIRDVTLNFRQTTNLRATGDRQVTEGDLALRRAPERFRVRFTSPVEQTALFDGTALWLHLAAAGQAFTQRASAPDLARLLGINPASPVRSMKRGYQARVEGHDGAGVRISFTRSGTAPMRWMVRVSATDWLMREASFENDEVGVSLECYDYRVNRGIPPAVFRLELPPDTEVSDGLPMMPGMPRP